MYRGVSHNSIRMYVAESFRRKFKTRRYSTYKARKVHAYGKQIININLKQVVSRLLSSRG